MTTLSTFTGAVVALVALPCVLASQAPAPQGKPAMTTSLATATTTRDVVRAKTDTTRMAAIPATDQIDAATRDFKATGVARIVTEGNFITFPYGHSQPTLTCARLRACIIELQA